MQVTSLAQLNTIVFKDKATASLGRKLTSLFPGIGYAAGYKVSLSEAP
jgi:hypothetical protein